jgi:hypothetical protein
MGNCVGGTVQQAGLELEQNPKQEELLQRRKIEERSIGLSMDKACQSIQKRSFVSFIRILTSRVLVPL